VDFSTAKVLVTCGIDRFGLAETLDEMGANVILRRHDVHPQPAVAAAVAAGAAAHGPKTLLPIVTRLPFKWVYPTGGKQDAIVPKYERGTTGRM
jgi:hypothetical protein